MVRPNSTASPLAQDSLVRGAFAIRVRGCGAEWQLALSECSAASAVAGAAEPRGWRQLRQRRSVRVTTLKVHYCRRRSNLHSSPACVSSAQLPARVFLENIEELKRCSMAHNCLQCIKYLMFVFNLLFWFFIMLLIVFLLELTIVILFFVYTDKIDKYAQRDLKKGLHLYGTDGNIGLTNAWSIIQTDFRCCGVSNYTDWFDVYNTTRVPDSCCLEFSENCGLHSPGTWWKAPCYETVKIWLQENLLAVGIFGLCTALVQILGLTFAMTMYCQVVKADTYCA
ncbi:tetraspanin-4 isoform X2 [Pelodiscus sinensis]|uniref:tetraspanin-4 isoform X2 n=1 Tax=Pelodiscus sinensis TaxID=13735 RepID=UPI003F6C647A